MEQNAPPSDFSVVDTDWIATQEGIPASAVEGRIQQIRQCVVNTTMELCARVQGPVHSGNTPGPAFILRVWSCLDYHWRRIAERNAVSFDAVLAEMHSPKSVSESDDPGVLHDVVFAQALQDGEVWAAERFERDYMPLVRAVARRAGGERAVDRVDNFAAELILPRDGRPPKIASYQGKTSLNAWLRAVVANFCISDFRKQREVTLEAETDRSVESETDELTDRTQCETLLSPVFRTVIGVLNDEDRVLISMLILDDVPQKSIAVSLGINSGNVTRRRQRILQSIWNEMSGLAAESQSEQSFADCLDLILTGRDQVLRERLTEVLASGFRGDGTDSGRADS